MFNSKLILNVLAVALFAAVNASASAACADGQVALANAQAASVILNSSCSVLDAKAVGDHDICGTYNGGSQVSCDAGGDPIVGHLGGGGDITIGRDFGNCVSTSGTCGPAGTSEPFILEWCCEQIF